MLDIVSVEEVIGTGKWTGVSALSSLLRLAHIFYFESQQVVCLDSIKLGDAFAFLMCISHVIFINPGTARTTLYSSPHKPDRLNETFLFCCKTPLVLVRQLFALGAIPSPRLEFDTDCMSILEDMFEDHGDMLALQYGGSQLVHRIRTYRKTAHWGSQGNDIVQTMQRYYSNTVTGTMATPSQVLQQHYQRYYGNTITGASAALSEVLWQHHHGVLLQLHYRC